VNPLAQGSAQMHAKNRRFVSAQVTAVVTMCLFSHCPSRAARDLKQRTAAVGLLTQPWEG